MFGMSSNLNWKLAVLECWKIYIAFIFDVVVSGRKIYIFRALSQIVKALY